MICALRAAGRSNGSGTVVSVMPTHAAHGQCAATGRLLFPCGFLAVVLLSAVGFGGLVSHGCRDLGTGVAKLRGLLRRETGRPSLQARAVAAVAPRKASTPSCASL